MSRRHFNERDVIETLIGQGVTIGCFRCKYIFEALDCRDRTIEREHLTEIALGGADSPDNCVYSHKACHDKITNGTKATSVGSSKQRIAKVKRLRNPKPSRRPMPKSKRKLAKRADPWGRNLRAPRP